MSKTDPRPPRILTTGRWLCSECYREGLLTVIPEGAKSCRLCGSMSFQPEYDPDALAEGERRREDYLKKEEA